MSIEKPLREMVQAELRGRLGPMHKAITRMDERLEVIEDLVDIIQRLAPLATRMQSLQRALPGMSAPSAPVVARGRGAAAAAVPVPAARAKQAAEVVPARRVGPPEAGPEDERRCAVIGCKRPARSKGYCSAHYQKLRLLVKTNRRPDKWVDDAAPQSVPDVVLPRGRAGAKAREEAMPQRPEPAVPPKPKAWVRKKGAQERISLH
ncbi:cell wall protein [Archangium sp.]|uniref:cell wall protein n=1 Tax=Archangium sp. TaxID=1872627 RepID=UPI002D46E980|nr:cell wall protein [Archangium sp.]HYO53703.1 cell wall protein [Archangium sp.]